MQSVAAGARVARAAVLLELPYLPSPAPLAGVHPKAFLHGACMLPHDPHDPASFTTRCALHRSRFSAGAAPNTGANICTVQHYPARLHQLYILELPIILRWVLGAVKHLIHPSTAGRIRTCTASEACLPLPLSALDESVSTSVSLLISPCMCVSLQPSDSAVCGVICRLGQRLSLLQAQDISRPICG